MNSYSVITICLNCESTIARTIESVLFQEIPPKQYIFVLGCSKDDSKKVILSYKSNFEEQGIDFTLIEEKTKSKAGIPIAWNLGLERVNSDIVAILNADDYYPQKSLMLNVVNKFNLNSDCFLVSGAIEYDNKNKIYSSKSQSLFPFLNPINHPATFVSKKLYDMIGLYNTSYVVSADYEFLYRAFSLGFKFLIDNEIIVAMSQGGFASQNRKIGRNEALKIASVYSKYKFLPFLAYILRFVLGR